MVFSLRPKIIAKLLVVDDLPRRSGPGRSHRSLPRPQVVADELILDRNINRTSSRSARSFDRTFFWSEVFLFRGVAMAEREWSLKQNWQTTNRIEQV
jgi:hypothetical protein